MKNDGKHESMDDFVNQLNVEGLTNSSDASTIEAISSNAGESSGVGSGSVSREDGVDRTGVGLTERLIDVIVDDGDGDLLLQQSDREDRVLQWLQALDMQVMGACRADERIKPLLKVNVSSAVAEDRLLARLIQNLEPPEVGMLARCFCIPLVSIRVGKVNRQGMLLFPTAIRGNLSLMLLPTADLRLSFLGDDGQNERLFTLGCRSQCADVVVDYIPADNSGRSFLVKGPDGIISYYWCSEKSKLLGIELLSKMKDLIKRKPSIAELTGVNESRLSSFAAQLRAYLVGATANLTQACISESSLSSSDTGSDVPDVEAAQMSSILRSQPSSSHMFEATTSYESSLCPRTSSLEEGPPRNLSSPSSAAREKLWKHGESYLPLSDNLTVASQSTSDLCSSEQPENGKFPDVRSIPLIPDFLESLKFVVPPLTPASQVSSIVTPFFSPYYSWCPPRLSILQTSTALPEFPTSSADSFRHPPLSSLLPVNNTPILLKPASSNLANASPVEFPALLPDPSGCVPTASSQQIPTFTPLICDSIVHIPLIDICSSGQGYLVSAGPAISTISPPMYPLLPKTDSVLESGARETLRLLISSSSQTSPPLLDVLPAVLKGSDENSIFVAGSRGLYCATRDVNAIADGIAAMGLLSLSGASMGTTLIQKLNSPDSLNGTSSESEAADPSSFSEGSSNC